MAHASAYARAKIGGEDRVDPWAVRCAAPVERCRVSRQCSRRAAPSPLALSMGAHKHQERSDSTMICPLAKPQGRRRSFVDEVRRRVLARRTSSSRDSSARFARTAFPLLKSTRRAGGGARTGLFHDERATRARDGVHIANRECGSGTPRGTHDYICVLLAMTRILARWRYPEFRSFSSVG